MFVTESGRRSLNASCRLLGYTRQAFYKQKLRIERKAISAELQRSHFGQVIGGRQPLGRPKSP